MKQLQSIGCCDLVAIYIYSCWISSQPTVWGAVLGPIVAVLLVSLCAELEWTAISLL